MKECNMSQSFCQGHGNIEHNLRQLKDNGNGHGIRQNGIQERRFINVYSDTNVNSEKLINDTIAKRIKEPLAKLNEKHIASGHPERVRTIADWIKTQRYVKGDKPRQIVHEIVVQVGNKIDGCPYEIQRDKQGRMLDIHGRIVRDWDTRKKLAYKDGTITESAISKRLKRVYKQFVREFQKKNPQLVVLCWAVHGDELGGLHLHVNYIAFNKTKNSVGVGLSKTTAFKQQYESMGITCGTDRKNNAQNMWRNDMRALLEQVCLKNGITRKDMENHEPHRDRKKFYEFKDKYCDEMEQRENKLELQEELIKDKMELLKQKEKEIIEKEKEVNKSMVKNEWYILKTKHADWYEIIHNECKEIKKNVLDKRTNVVYNSIIR